MTDPRIRCQILLLLAALLVALLAPLAAAADVIDYVNSVRRHGCGGHAGGLVPLRESTRLDEVARQLAQGAELRAAQQLAGYHAASAFSVQISGVPPSGDVGRVIVRQYCEQSTNPAFREIGTFRRGADVWLALAEPFAPPAGRDRAAISRRVLELTNEARARARQCGSAYFEAAPPLAPNAILERAAAQYARDMATYGYMDHTGRDGSSPEERITRSGYRWRETGENLASGIMTPEDAVAGWLRSPEHCANLMDPAFRHMGVAYAVNPRLEAGVYWAQEFGAPR
ncbi:MAG: CAP domain-containing protein [Gammaproteobacteria bacterium]|nr:MAG: CAP domain-containing protein [Gammaproteobacteria bacterium]